MPPSPATRFLAPDNPAASAPGKGPDPGKCQVGQMWTPFRLERATRVRYRRDHRDSGHRPTAHVRTQNAG